MERLKTHSPALYMALVSAVGMFLSLRWQIAMAICLWSFLLPHPSFRQFLSLSCICIILFSLSLRTQYWKPWTGIPSEDIVWVQGVLIEDSRRSDNRTMLIISLESVKNMQGALADARKNILMYINESMELSAGVRITASGNMYPSPRGLSFRVGSIQTQGFHNKFWSFRYQLRQWVMKRLSHLDRDVRSLLYALLIGNREYMDPLLLELFRKSGNMHVLALSGMHLTLLAAVLIWALRSFCSLRLNYGITILFLGGYVVLAGFFPSLIRAYIMFLVYAMLRMTSIPVRISTIMSISFLVILVFHPATAFSLSYHLSFAALSGIILLGTRLSNRLSGYLPRAIRDPWCASVGAVIFSSPVTLTTFGFLPPFSFLFSPIVGLGIAVIFLLGLSQVILPVRWIIPQVLSGVYAILIWSVRIAHRLPSISLDNIIFLSLFFVAAICTIIFLWRDE